MAGSTLTYPLNGAATWENFPDIVQKIQAGLDQVDHGSGARRPTRVSTVSVAVRRVSVTETVLARLLLAA